MLTNVFVEIYCPFCVHMKLVGYIPYEHIHSIHNDVSSLKCLLPTLLLAMHEVALYMVNINQEMV